MRQRNICVIEESTRSLHVLVNNKDEMILCASEDKCNCCMELNEKELLKLHAATLTILRDRKLLR